MAYTHAVAPRSVISTPAASGPSLLRRAIEAFAAARVRQAEREIALYLRRTGRFTDETEREIEHRFFGVPRR